MTACTQCGTENLPEAKFCHSCGAALPQPASMDSPAKLTTAGGQVFPLTADSKIGSDSANDIRLAGSDNFHAEIIYNGMDWILYRRSNGEVKLNDQPVGSFGFLRNGDRVTIGTTVFTFALTAASLLPDLPGMDRTPTPPSTPVEEVSSSSKPFQPEAESHWVAASSTTPEYTPPPESVTPTPETPPVEEEVYNVEKPYAPRATPVTPTPTWTPSSTPPVSTPYNAPKPYPQTATGTKNRYVAALLAIFLGSFGAHRFYLGQMWWGVAYLAFFWAYIPGIAGIVEGIMYLMMSDADFARKYG